MVTRTFPDARDAIRNANILASESNRARVVAYVRPHGWVSYDPVSESVKNAEPEFLCLGLGRIPLPIGEHAVDVFYSALRATERT